VHGILKTLFTKKDSDQINHKISQKAAEQPIIQKDKRTIKETMEYVQRKMFEIDDLESEDMQSQKRSRPELLRNAMAGDKKAYLDVKDHDT